jgi:hypothetical protein
MQTVNFQCGHCAKLMAVGVEYLGQQVRCPHCQQVVIAPLAAAPPAPVPAPAPAPAPAPEPAPDPFAFPRMHTDHEDIFSQRTEPEDALFGQPDPPRLEIPREPAPAPMPPLDLTEPDGPPRNGDATEPLVEPLPNLEPTVSLPPGPSFTATEQPVTSAPAPLTETQPWVPTDSQPDVPREASLTAARLRREQEAKKSFGSMMFIMLVFMPTLLWALGATGIGVYLYIKLLETSRQPSMWDEIPDAAGDTPGFRPAGKKTSKTFELQYDERKATTPLPEHLKVPLGETIRVGDLEVTPTRVRRQRMSVRAVGSERAEPLPNESLVLYLKLKNVADDYAFTPLDNYFDRQWKRIGPAPLTVLQALDRNKNFFGGPTPWVSKIQAQKNNIPREWVDGRKDIDRAGLAPGEEMESFTCTDGSNEKTARFLFGDEVNERRIGGYHGEFLWRVHLRRGKIIRNGRPYSATAVIGVQFSDSDYDS